MALVKAGHWQTTHWAESHFMQDHWPEYGALPTIYPPFLLRATDPQIILKSVDQESSLKAEDPQVILKVKTEE